ncbi:MAG TPA: TolC family protein [Candidatus Polarisedimenticolia bacterium]|nr:TolC family protein [Candidatus Polarisedimenticolia bacterium]
MEEALRLSDKSPVAASLGLEVDRAQAEVRASGLWPNPEVFVSREEALGTVDRFATLALPLPLTGRLSLERSAARSALKATEARTRLARVRLVRARVREAFLELLVSQARSSSLATGFSRLSELVEVLRAREKEGEASGFDRMRAERERAEFQADLLESQGQVVRPRAELAALVGLPSESLVAEGNVETAPSLPSLEEARVAVATRGDLLALDAETERTDYLARAARRRAIPEPSLTLGAKTTEVANEADTGSVAAISIPIPLFDHGQGSRAIARAEGALLRSQREALSRQALAEAEAALAQAAARREAAESYAAADADELIRIARAAYDVGEMRILELLDAYRTAIHVSLRTIDLYGEARRAEIELDRALGAEVVR